jgi:hypothetical protein
VAANSFVNTLLMPFRILMLPFKVIGYFIKKLAMAFWERRSPMNWTLLTLVVVAIISAILWTRHDDLKWNQPKSLFDQTRSKRHGG